MSVIRMIVMMIIIVVVVIIIIIIYRSERIFERGVDRRWGCLNWDAVHDGGRRDNSRVIVIIIIVVIVIQISHGWNVEQKRRGEESRGSR